MPTSNEHTITVSGIEVQVVRKDIKNLHLAVYPPNGHVRVAVPLSVTDDNIRLAVISKLSWIRQQQKEILSQPRQSRREMVSGESHYLWGKRYRLEVVERQGRHEMEIKNNQWLRLYVTPNTTTSNRKLVLDEWYRDQIKARMPDLIARWEPVIGEKVSDWGVKKMKTKWGSCTIEDRRIWVNLELAKKPPECLEYIVVHEMVHLLERHHNDNFLFYMDKFLPEWRLRRDLLNSYPLAHESWMY
jgi:hypothetical protein